jgi:non-specific serine/threonine protein kinase/serine/threonine-protein kinase
MLKGAGPGTALGRDTTMLREILDHTARRLDAELRDSPEVAMDLRETLGLVDRELGDYATAEPLLRKVVEYRRTQNGNGSPELAAALDNLGDLLRLLNRSAEADAALQEALAIRRGRFGDKDPVVADTLFHLSQVPNVRRSLADSEKMLTEVLAIRRNAFGAESPAIAETIEALGTVARERGEHEKAAALDAEALAMTRKVLGNDHPAVARALDSLGYSLLHVGQKAEARASYREAFFLRRKLLGAQHPQLVVALLRFVGQIPAAEADDATVDLVRAFIADQRKVLPGGSPLLVPTLLALANLLERPERDPSQAASSVREAGTLLDESLKHGPPLDVEVIDAMGLHGWWKFMDGHASEAVTMNRAALEMARAAFGRTGRGVVLPNRILAWIYFGAARFDDAVAQFEETIRVDRAALPPGHMFMGMDVAGLGATYRKLGRVADSQRVLEEALNSWKWGTDFATPSPVTIPAVLCELGLTLNQEGRFDEAERVLRESLRMYDLGRTPTLGLRVHPRARAESGLGTALAGQKKFAEAEPLLIHAFEELKTNESSYGGDARAMVREASEAVVALYDDSGRFPKAAEWRAARP